MFSVAGLGERDSRQYNSPVPRENGLASGIGFAGSPEGPLAGPVSGFDAERSPETGSHQAALNTNGLKCLDLRPGRVQTARYL